MRKAALLSLALATTVLAAEPPAEVVITKDSVSSFYREFKRLTKEPLCVSQAISVGCTSGPVSIPTPRPARHGNHTYTPGTIGGYTHANPCIHIYANALADATITKKRHTFPVGSVIVKEKLGTNGGIGGMVKRSPGFDPRNGDWEWFYSDKATGFTMGKMQNCADCHANSKDKDYVISVWKLAK